MRTQMETTMEKMNARGLGNGLTMNLSNSQVGSLMDGQPTGPRYWQDVNPDNPEEMMALYHEAKRWADGLRNLVGLLGVLTGMISRSTVGGEEADDGRRNEYFCPRVKERQVKRYVEELLAMRPNGQWTVRYKYQWFALYNQFAQRGWIAGPQDLRRFCRQMQLWFPDARVPFDYKGVVKGAEDTRRHAYRLTEARISEEFDHRERYLRNRY